MSDSTQPPEPAHSPDPVQAWEAYVSGRVQRVGFRAACRRRARELGLVGWVQNELDGRVHVWLEGSEEATNSLLDWLKTGPESAEVDTREAIQRPPQWYSDFVTRH